MSNAKQAAYRIALLLLVCLLALCTAPDGRVAARESLATTAAARLAFISDRDGNRNIYSMNADGSSQTNLSQSSAGEQAFAWSPDGTRIAFTKRESPGSPDDSNLYLMNADGSGVTQVTSNDFQHINLTNLSWSPDGSKLAYVSGDDLVHYLSVVNIDGTNKRLLRETNGPFLDLVWSPDGNKIAYSLGSDFNSSNLWVMNVDGSAVTRITNHEEPGIYSRSPSWSPDSTRLVFETNRDGNDEIYMAWVRLYYSSAALNITRLTTTPAADVDPAWAPDGQLIAFSSNRDSNFEIYTMRWDDGSNLTRLTNNSAADGEPEWQPLGTTPFVPEDFIQFSRASYRTFEDPVGNAGAPLEIVITRLGGLTDRAFVGYATSDGTASGLTDYTPVQGRVEFAPGQASVSFNIPVTYDSFLEGNETVNLDLLYVGGSPKIMYGVQRHAVLTIADFYVNSPVPNAIDLSENFVRQQYHDFLGREPDTTGLSFWTNQITACGANSECVGRKRVDVSGAFFNSIEFQNTGYFVYRMTLASFGQFPQFVPFMVDKGQVAEGIIVGQTGWQQRLAENKTRFIAEWMRRSEFITLCGGPRPNSEFVGILLTNTQLPVTAEYRAALIADLDAGRKSQADVLTEIVEHPELMRIEFNRAFVLMQYFGYLRRNPNDPPDNNFEGYNFWLRKLNDFNGDYRRAEMVKAFILSTEYRRRFGQ